MYLVSKDKKECCGCKACANVCPVNAISFVSDNEGFWYPVINTKKCIGCKKCEKVCTYNEVEFNNNYDVFAAWSLDSELRDASSSGGIFTLLAEQILLENGVIVGAAYDDDFVVKHICIEKIEDLSRLRKSKYVQSDTEFVFVRAKNYLDEGRKVIFSGTPCQIAGFKSFLQKDYDNLLLCEVLCYGVPSPKVFKEYIKYNEEKAKSKIINIDFKDKRYGWDYYTTALYFENGKSKCQFGGDSYKKFMHNNWSIRPSCLDCHYDINHSIADISLGDFYGYHKYCSEKEPKNGVSCVALRNKRHKSRVDNLENTFIIKVDSNAFSKNEIKKEKAIDFEVRDTFFNTIFADYTNGLNLIEKDSLINKGKKKIREIRRRIQK